MYWNAYVWVQHPDFSSWKINASPHPKTMTLPPFLLSLRLIEEEALSKKWSHLNYQWKMRLNGTGISSTQLCSGSRSHLCSHRALPTAPAGSQLYLPVLWGAEGRSGARGSLQECGARAMGSKGTMLPARPRVIQENSPLHSRCEDGLLLTLPLTGAGDISSCRQELCYNLCKAEEGTAPHPFPLSRLWWLSILRHWVFWVRIKEGKGTAQCSYPNCIIVLYV